MKTSLAERYIAATIAELPEELRDEVRSELYASIADAIEARMLAGEDRDTAEHAVLTELGDPAVLAAGYADKPLQLIGPKYYMPWRRLLKRLLAIIPPIVFVISALAQVLSGGDIGTVISEAILATMSAILHIFFWVTLAFAIVERTGSDVGVGWSVEDLPEPQEDDSSRADMVASLIFLGIFTIGLVWDQIWGLLHLEGQAIHILNPELWPWTMTLLLVLLGLEAVFAVALYLRRGWSVTMAIINTAIAVGIFSWFITLLVRGDLVSAEFLQFSFTNADSPETLRTVATIFGFGVGIVAAWDIIDGWVKTYRASSAS